MHGCKCLKHARFSAGGSPVWTRILLKIKGFRFVPDFEFFDVGNRCFYEVFGYSSEDYQKAKGIKIDYWEDKKIFLKRWDGKGRVPNLPTKDEAAEYHERLRQAKKSKRARV